MEALSCPLKFVLVMFIRNVLRKNAVAALGAVPEAAPRIEHLNLPGTQLLANCLRLAWLK
jgi:hypothetical protein